MIELNKENKEKIIKRFLYKALTKDKISLLIEAEPNLSMKEVNRKDLSGKIYNGTVGAEVNVDILDKEEYDYIIRDAFRSIFDWMQDKVIPKELLINFDRIIDTITITAIVFEGAERLDERNFLGEIPYKGV